MRANHPRLTISIPHPGPLGVHPAAPPPEKVPTPAPAPPVALHRRKFLRACAAPDAPPETLRAGTTRQPFAHLLTCGQVRSRHFLLQSCAERAQATERDMRFCVLAAEEKFRKRNPARLSDPVRSAHRAVSAALKRSQP